MIKLFVPLAARAIFQMTEEEICAAGRWELVDTEDPLVRSFIEEGDRTGEAKGTLVLLRKGLQKFTAELSSSTFIDSKGEQKKTLIIREITARDAFEELLEKAVDLTDSILGG